MFYRSQLWKSLTLTSIHFQLIFDFFQYFLLKPMKYNWIKSDIKVARLLYIDPPKTFLSIGEGEYRIWRFCLPRKFEELRNSFQCLRIKSSSKTLNLCVGLCRGLAFLANTPAFGSNMCFIYQTISKLRNLQFRPPCCMYAYFVMDGQ